MKPGDLEDLTLLLIRDADEADMWIDRWALSYPITERAECAATQPLAEQQSHVAQAFARIHSESIMVVAHGAGAAAFMAWYGTLGMLAQRRIKGVILAAPPQAACQHNAVRYVRLMCNKAALVVGQNSGEPQKWAAEQASLWGARLLVSPHPGHLNGALGGWQWGMKLMQEMLLA
ncbi:MAG: alpha/beta hydrolase [Neisseria sp.]|uniref:alpha/beta hydrolase n=1 Tax=Neisseria sp. TaxID=192066 RepID=UPI0026DC134A|nr:alpha/beta hydrolase [Neisseria sp.]MDO4640523.1 alpha/beta hydrolase [Neisseria sp.]